MVKYKVNIMFKEDGKTLNDVITKVLKIELQKKFGMICINGKSELSSGCTHYSQKEGGIN